MNKKWARLSNELIFPGIDRNSIVIYCIWLQARLLLLHFDISVNRSMLKRRNGATNIIFNIVNNCLM